MTPNDVLTKMAEDLMERFMKELRERAPKSLYEDLPPGADRDIVQSLSYMFALAYMTLEMVKDSDDDYVRALAQACLARVRVEAESYEQAGRNPLRLVRNLQ